VYDQEDDRGVPISQGIPPLVTWVGLGGVVLIFVVAGIVLATAGSGHVWPAADTLTIKL
jgi:hypothetical protein